MTVLSELDLLDSCYKGGPILSLHSTENNDKYRKSCITRKEAI